MLISELTDVIIDHLHDDKPSLSACGLTCRTWLPSSRYHLFSHTTLKINTVHSFADLLINASNNIAFVVQHLTITCPTLDAVDEKRLAQSNEILQMLPTITIHLPKVRSLALHNLDLTLSACLSRIVRWQILSDLGSKVKSLELGSLRAHVLQDVIDIICIFPLLTELSFEAIGPSYADLKLLDLSHEGSSSFIMSDQPRPLFNLNVIDLRCALPDAFVHWLFISSSQVHTVRCTPDTDGGIILRRAGASIRKIDVSLDDFCWEQSVSTIDITKCTNLQSLRFHSIRSDLKKFADEQKQLMLSLLTQVSSPSIEEVSFAINDGTGKNPWKDHFDWDSLVDALLCCHFWGNLKRVRIEWPIARQPQIDKIHGAFRPISERGLLQLNFV